jgi:predicted dehydrogenase
MMAQESKMLRFGIIGAGSIASDIARAMHQCTEVELVAIASRREEQALEFARKHKISKVFENWHELVHYEGVDAVYVATPTHIREEICLGVAEMGKHLLADKPFAGENSLRRIYERCRLRDLVFMDGTHFTHNPRTQMVRSALKEQVGTAQHLRSSFFFPADDIHNIRFQPDKEPTGAVGDLGWYNMRAICEYLTERGELRSITGSIQRHPQTGSVIRGSGWASFESSQTTCFDFGYSVGAQLMDLEILGDLGVIQIPDYVLDYKQSYIFQNPGLKTSYDLRKGIKPRSEAQTVIADSDVPQHVIMIQNFARLCSNSSKAERESKYDLARQTQELLDAYWEAVRA